MTDHALAARGDDFDLRDVVPRVLPALPKLGNRAPARPALHLHDYVDSAVKVPPAVHRSHLDHDFPMYLNDRLGDCGEAMTLHGIEAFHLDAKTPVPPFADADAEALYEKVGGYVPGDASTDKGTDNQVLAEHWTNEGVVCATDGSIHKIVGTLGVDPRNTDLCKRAIWEFVVLFQAIGLPVTAQGQSSWDLLEKEGNGALGSWGYHDVAALSYDPRRIRVETWGTSILQTWDFFDYYAVPGCFVVLTEEMLDREGTSPAGVNWTKLCADFKSL